MGRWGRLEHLFSHTPVSKLAKLQNLLTKEWLGNPSTVTTVFFSLGPLHSQGQAEGLTRLPVSLTWPVLTPLIPFYYAYPVRNFAVAPVDPPACPKLLLGRYLRSMRNLVGPLASILAPDVSRYC